MSKIDTFVVLTDEHNMSDIIRKFVEKLSVRNEIKDIDYKNNTFYLTDDCAIMFRNNRDFDPRNTKLPDESGEPIQIKSEVFLLHLKSYEPGTCFYYHLDQVYLPYKKLRNKAKVDVYLEGMGLKPIGIVHEEDAIIIDSLPKMDYTVS